MLMVLPSLVVIRWNFVSMVRIPLKLEIILAQWQKDFASHQVVHYFLEQALTQILKITRIEMSDF